MSTPLILEPLLGEARAAAMAGGLNTICLMQILVGEDSRVDPEELTEQLSSYFVGALLGGCQVAVERGPGDAVKLISIEGYVASSIAWS